MTEHFAVSCDIPATYKHVEKFYFNFEFLKKYENPKTWYIEELNFNQEYKKNLKKIFKDNNNNEENEKLALRYL